MKELLTHITGPQIMILIGGILTLIGAFWSTQQDNFKEKIINEKNQIIINKTEEISGLNAHIVDVLTGGQSFPEVTIGLPDGIPIVKLNGEFPLSNINGSFVNIRELRKEQRKNGFTGQSNSYDFKKDIISPAFADVLVRKRFDLKNGGRFMIHFYTPYHTFQQNIAIETNPNNGEIMQAHQVYKDKELIHTEYPDNFPIPLEKINFLEQFSKDEVEVLKKKATPKFPL